MRYKVYGAHGKLELEADKLEEGEKVRLTQGVCDEGKIISRWRINPKNERSNEMIAVKWESGDTQEYGL